MRIYVPYAGTAVAVVMLDRAAGPGGAVVDLESSDPGVATCPASVSLTEGMIGVGFTVTWVSAGDATITATLSGASEDVFVTCEDAGSDTFVCPASAELSGAGELEAVSVVHASVEASAELSGAGELEANENCIIHAARIHLQPSFAASSGTRLRPSPGPTGVE